MASPREEIAHVIRHLSFAPSPGQVRRLEAQGAAQLARDMVDQADDLGDLPGDDAFEGDQGARDLIGWWFDRMRSPDAGLHERMTWFWHGHFTSGMSKVPPPMMWRQHLTLRRLALGNFRELLLAMLNDAAMLVWLDGVGSSPDQPNENLARETLELFALGIGNYEEADVKAIATVMAGRGLDWDAGVTRPEAPASTRQPVEILGERRRWDLSSLVDHLLAQPACAPFIVGRLHHHLVGIPPTADRAAELAAEFRAGDFELRPLLEAMLLHPDLVEARYRRTRQPIEWLIAAFQALGHAEADFGHWRLAEIGQQPFNPPNVAGWPLDDRWLGPGQVLQRAAVLVQMGVPDAVAAAVPAELDAVLERCSIFDVTAETRDALTTAATTQTDPDQRRSLLFTLALTSPEFTVA